LLEVALPTTLLSFLCYGIKLLLVWFEALLLGESILLPKPPVFAPPPPVVYGYGLMTYRSIVIL